MDINLHQRTFHIQNKHLLTLKDYTPSEIFEILYMARDLKKSLKAGEFRTDLKGKTLAMIFAKSSTRTRVSFEMGIRQLGGEGLFLSSNDIQLGRGETIHDTVKVLERMSISGIMIRTFKQSDVEDLAKYGTIPIINGLTDLCHPCQVLADLLTIWERKRDLQGRKLVFFGDGNNMANSLMVGCAKCGMEVVVACPEGYEPDQGFLEHAQKYGPVSVSHDPKAAAKGADVLYTDVFFSMGQKPDPRKFEEMMRFQVNDELMALAKPDAMFLHCLPAPRGEEVTASVIDSPASFVFDEAENRLHAQKAVMYFLMK